MPGIASLRLTKPGGRVWPTCDWTVAVVIVRSGGGDGRQSGNHPNRARKGDRHLSVPSPGRRASRNASRAEDPGFTIRAAQVLTRFPGASPERIEQLVTDPIEEAIQELPEIDFISSTSKTEWST